MPRALLVLDYSVHKSNSMIFISYAGHKIVKDKNVGNEMDSNLVLRLDSCDFG